MRNTVIRGNADGNLRYQAKLAQRPLLTQAVMSAVCFLSMLRSNIDLASFRFFLAREMYSHNRWLRGKVSASMRLLELVAWRCMADVRNVFICETIELTIPGVFGPAATKWYQFLQKKINLRTNIQTTAARVMADQTIFASTNMFLFLSSMSIMEGSDPREKLKKSYVPGLKANWLVWPAVQSVNFTMVPLEHRVLVVNIVSLGWNCFLSYLNSS
jgi:hypothetical protein